MQTNVIVLSSDYQLNYMNTVNLVDCTNGNINISMDYMVNGYGDGVHFYIKKIDSTANTITLIPYVGDIINGTSSYVMATSHIHIMSYQGVWYILDQ